MRATQKVCVFPSILVLEMAKMCWLQKGLLRLPVIMLWLKQQLLSVGLGYVLQQKHLFISHKEDVHMCVRIYIYIHIYIYMYGKDLSRPDYDVLDFLT